MDILKLVTDRLENKIREASSMPFSEKEPSFSKNPSSLSALQACVPE